MRRLQHLAGVLRVEIRVVVVESVRDFEQDFAQRRGIANPDVGFRQVSESLLQARERIIEQEQGIGFEPAGHAGRSYPKGDSHL